MQINQQKYNTGFKGVIAYLAPEDSSRELREEMNQKVSSDSRILEQKGIETCVQGYRGADEFYLCHGEEGKTLNELKLKAQCSEFGSEASKKLKEFLAGLKGKITQVITFNDDKKTRFWKSKCSC